MLEFINRSSLFQKDVGIDKPMKVGWKLSWNILKRSLCLLLVKAKTKP